MLKLNPSIKVKDLWAGVGKYPRPVALLRPQLVRLSGVVESVHPQ